MKINNLEVIFNKENILKQQEQLEEKSSVLEELVMNIVNKYSKDLHVYTQYIDNILKDEQNPITIIELEQAILNIPVLMYYTGDKQEMIAINEDISKIIKQEKFNKSFEQSTGTIAARTKIAENESMEELIPQLIYQRANRVLKSRMVYANEILQSAKKVLTRRIIELELSRGEV